MLTQDTKAKRQTDHPVTVPKQKQAHACMPVLMLVMGLANGSEGEGTNFHVWWFEFNPRNPHGGGRELILFIRMAKAD